MSATTDSSCEIKYDPENKPGISNLINICVSLSDMSIQEVEEKFKNSNYGEFKRFTADIVCNKLSAIQKKYNEIINSDELDKILEQGAIKVNELAHNKYMNMRYKIGLYK